MTKIKLFILNLFNLMLGVKSRLLMKIFPNYCSRKARDADEVAKIDQIIQLFGSLGQRIGEMRGQLVVLEGRVNGLHAHSVDQANKLLGIESQLHQKTDRIDEDEKFMQEAKIANQIGIVARHEAKKTLTKGLDIVPGLVRTELQKTLGPDAPKALKLKKKRGLKRR